LGHALPAIEGTYNRYPYEPEMRHAYEMLASLIERIVKPSDNVVALQRG
jgi:hypothetical protein